MRGLQTYLCIYPVCMGYYNLNELLPLAAVTSALYVSISFSRPLISLRRPSALSSPAKVAPLAKINSSFNLVISSSCSFMRSNTSDCMCCSSSSSEVRVSNDTSVSCNFFSRFRTFASVSLSLLSTSPAASWASFSSFLS